MVTAKEGNQDSPTRAVQISPTDMEHLYTEDLVQALPSVGILSKSELSIPSPGVPGFSGSLGTGDAFTPPSSSPVTFRRKPPVTEVWWYHTGQCEPQEAWNGVQAPALAVFRGRTN